MLDTSSLKHLLDGVEKSIVAAVDDFFNAGIDNKLSACKTRRNRNINCRPSNRDTIIRSLADGILLSMRAETLVKMSSAFNLPGTPGTTAVEAVFNSTRSAVVPGRKNMVVFHYDGTYMTPHTVGTLGDDMGRLHEIIVPTRTRINDFLLRVYGFLCHKTTV